MIEVGRGAELIPGVGYEPEVAVMQRGHCFKLVHRSTVDGTTQFHLLGRGQLGDPTKDFCHRGGHGLTIPFVAFQASTRLDHPRLTDLPGRLGGS
jgi:hypothetical protein